MWCVPKYSNPTGETYSSETVVRLARMGAAADFRLFWDNAYAVHDLTGSSDRLDNVLDACAAAGNPDRALVFGSTSKITFAQAGLGMLATSAANMRWFVSRLSTRTIGPDKLNQMRHVRVLRDEAGIAAHMDQQRQLLEPKFAAVQEVFNARLGGTGVAAWTRPRGGYFVSLDVLDACAQRVVALAKAAGIEMVPAGRTFPYGRDPRDRNIRIAPSFPSADEVRAAVDALATCVLVATTERLLADLADKRTRLSESCPSTDPLVAKGQPKVASATTITCKNQRLQKLACVSRVSQQRRCTPRESTGEEVHASYTHD
jgi:DNA-binding transcriptional MocR family regulator